MYTPRLETVAAIHNKLLRYKYVQVTSQFEYWGFSDVGQIRGTPGSGKTTLAKLLRNFIMDRHPGSLVVRVPKWLPDLRLIQGWRPWLAAQHTWDGQGGSVLIVNEEQTLYWYSNFWDNIKLITPEWPYGIHTLASYGSIGTDSSVVTPHSPSQGQMGIHANVIDYGNDVKVGLLLTQDEFHAFVEKIFSGHRFDDQFLDGIYDLTAGHVGACGDVLRIVQVVMCKPGLKP
jgi:hypothetical protein